MSFRHPLENYLIICLFALASLLAAYGVVSAVNSGVSPQPKPIKISSAINCSFPDKSFCSTEQAFKNFVNNRDFSDILENQAPINITCSGTTKSQSYCKSARNGLVVQLFQVHEDNVSQVLTRNEYITFFNSYFRQNGPFDLAHVTTVKSGAILSYTNRINTKRYILTFTKTESVWQLAYPTVN